MNASDRGLDSLSARYLLHGDERAMEELVHRTRPRLLAAARRIAGRDEAEDCVQTAYLSLVHKRGEALAAPVVAWLLTAVVRIAYRRRAKARRWTAIERHLGWVRDSETPLHRAVRDEELRDLRARIDRLPSGLRDAVVLGPLEGLAAADVGRLLGISEAAVRKRQQRARALLRQPLPPRVAGAFLLVPWLLADAAAGIVPKGGIVVKKQITIATTLLALVALLGGWWALASGDGHDTARAIRDRGPRTEAARDAADPAPDAGGAVAPPAGSDPEPPPTLTGRVLDIDGRPLRGATVRWFSRDASGRAAAGADGRYALHADGAQVLVARAPGHAPLLLEIDADTARQDLFLTRGARVEGRVVRADGGDPVAGARVVLWSAEASRQWEDEDGRRVQAPWAPRVLDETRTDAHGAFAFDHVPAQAFHPVSPGGAGPEGPLVGHVRAHVEGAVCEAAGVPVRPAGDTVRVVLRCFPAAAIEGRVVDAFGRGVAGLRVFGATIHHVLPGWPERAVPEAPRPEAITDERGAYRLAGLPAPRGGGRANVFVRTVALDTRGPRAHATVRVEPGRVTQAAPIVWEPGDPAVARVSVRDPDGDPVGGARVRWDGFGAVGHTGPDGTALLEGWVKSRFGEPQRLTVSAAGFATARREVVGTAGETVEVAIVLPRGSTLRGCVAWSDGVPARGASVRVSAAGGRDGLASVQVDARGRFALAGLPAGPWHVRAMHGGHAVERTGVRADGELALVFDAASPETRTATVAGTVVDAASGEPVPRAPVWLDGEGGRVVAEIVGPGRFRAERVPPGRWTLRVPARDYLPFALGDLVLRAGETRDGIVVRLERGIRLRGTVRDRSRHALRGGAVVLVREDGWQPRSGLLDDAGTLRVDGLRPGRYHLFVHLARADGAEVATPRPRIVELAEGAGEVRVEVEVVDGGEVRCVPPDGVRAEAVEVVDDGGRTWLRVHGDAANRAHTALVPPGRYRVRWIRADAVVAEREHLVTSEPVADIGLGR